MTSQSGLDPSIVENAVPEPGVADGDGAKQEMLGKFILQRPLGAGGMGTVYLALDTETKKSVALKILPKDHTENPALVRRFEAEAESAAQLQHENIVSVYEAGKADGYLYIALEYVRGIDVARLLKKKGRQPVARTLEIVKQVTRALDHAFRKGIVHRDIKPSNVLIKRNGSIKLTDMGLARSVDETIDTGVTRDGTTVGTVDYMAPEQARDSKAADVRSDIYSLGCAWYHMLTGQPPFPKGSVTNKLYAHISDPRPDPRVLRSEVPDQIAQIILKMMARSPKERFQTPGELLEVLERVSFRGDAVSNKFLMTLEELVESDPDDPASNSSASSPAVATSRRGDRSLRQRLRNRKRTGAATEGQLQEYLTNIGIIIAGLTIATAVWWAVVSLM